jgi:hypothetical protein
MLSTKITAVEGEFKGSGDRNQVRRHLIHPYSPHELKSPAQHGIADAVDLGMTRLLVSGGVTL